MSKFQKGQSGNPAGRPKGAIGIAGRLRAAIQADAEQIIQRLITQATEGDTTAAKILLDRVCPALKPEAQAVELEAVLKFADIDPERLPNEAPDSDWLDHYRLQLGELLPSY